MCTEGARKLITKSQQQLITDTKKDLSLLCSFPAGLLGIGRSKPHRLFSDSKLLLLEARFATPVASSAQKIKTNKVDGPRRK
jgi:hypothetical protein